MNKFTSYITTGKAPVHFDDVDSIRSSDNPPEGALVQKLFENKDQLEHFFVEPETTEFTYKRKKWKLHNSKLNDAAKIVTNDPALDKTQYNIDKYFAEGPGKDVPGVEDLDRCY